MSELKIITTEDHIEMIKLCKRWGAIDFDLAMVNAAREGHIGMVKLCKEWGATEFDEAMRWAAKNGHIEIIKLCKEWGQRNLTMLCCMQLKMVISRL